MPDTPKPQPKKRCTIYLDALNWYFGIFPHRPAWNWLNVQSFFEALRLDEEVVTVKFFTALVDSPQSRFTLNRRPFGVSSARAKLAPTSRN